MVSGCLSTQAIPSAAGNLDRLCSCTYYYIFWIVAIGFRPGIFEISLNIRPRDSSSLLCLDQEKSFPSGGGTANLVPRHEKTLSFLVLGHPARRMKIFLA